MKRTLPPFKYILFVTSILTGFSSHAIDSAAIEQQANASIIELYHTLNSKPNTSMVKRIDWISEQFKDTKYILGALGEGPTARYDQYPRYRTDGFDCDTYVNTVLALALANSMDTFKNCLRFTRYKDGRISYINRNHFTSIDWNKNNQKRGVLKDITLSITNKKKQPIALFAEALINKPNWYAHKQLNTIRLQHEDLKEQEARLSELKVKGSKLKSTESKLPYIPLTALFSKNGEPDLYLFAQIPNGAIIEIVRPNWDLRKQIGTALNISHLGFAVWIKNQLYFRQASSHYGKVVDVPMIDYLKEARNSPTIKGVNVQIVLPQKPVSSDCRLFYNESFLVNLNHN